MQFLLSGLIDSIIKVRMWWSTTFKGRHFNILIQRVQKLRKKGLHNTCNLKDPINGIFLSWEVAKVVLV
jgi:hypothetical protein